MTITPLVLLFTILTFTESLSAAAEEILQQASANGTRNLRPFTVKDGWELRWDTKSPMFTVMLHSTTGELVDTLATQMQPGPGVTYYPKGGTYYLQIIASGDWTVTVIQLP